MYKRCEKCYENDKTPSNTDCDKCEIEENICHHKALEEIEEICLEDTRTFADGTQVRYDSLDKILDIINKAKGEDK